MSGGGGASGETRYNWNDDMAPRWNNLLNSGFWSAMQPDGAGGFTARPRENYMGQRYAPLAYDQMAAGANIRNLNDQSLNTIQTGNHARNSITGTLHGNHLTGPWSNPHANLDAASLNSYISGNEFKGESPAFNAMMGDVMGDMAQGYEQGTSAELTRLMNLSGNLGGSAHLNAMSNNQNALAKQMGQASNQMRSAQFDKSAGLRENELNRGFDNFNRGLDRGTQAFENERGRQMQAIGYGQNEQGMALDRANAQLGIGQMFQGQDQKGLDFDFDQWTQRQNHPFTSMGWLADLYGRAMGGGGMNQSIYGGSGNSAAPWLGAALGAYSMFGQ